MPFVGYDLGVMARLLKNWRSDCKYKIQTSTRREYMFIPHCSKATEEGGTLSRKMKCVVHPST
jgi:hypothetical protein